MEFKVGDKVKATVNGKEYIGFIQRIDEGLYIVDIGGGEQLSFLFWQLTRVEEPASVSSKWLLEGEELDMLRVGPYIPCCECRARVAHGAARHLAEELRKRNLPTAQGSVHHHLYLEGKDWAELQKAVGL